MLLLCLVLHSKLLQTRESDTERAVFDIDPFLYLASGVKRGYMEPMPPDGGMPELLKRQIERLETAIDLSTDWLEIQYLMIELDLLKALYEEAESEAA